MTTMTPELRKAVEQSGDEPVRLVDPVSQVAYVLLPAEEYDWLKVASSAAPEDSPEAAYPLIDEVFGRSGWDDPRMDEYNDYESRRP